jgi:hypothetical protein
VQQLVTRSTAPHAWRSAFALFALAVWFTVAVAWLITGPALLWLLRAFGPWTWGQLDA